MDDKTFYFFYEERINRAINELQNECRSKNFWSESIQKGIVIDLYEVFHKAAVRCLIVELHVCKNAGILCGKTVREEYESYCRILKDRQYIDAIYQKYPGLFRYLEKLEEIQIFFWKELLERLINDWRQIKDYFQLDEKSVILSVRRSGSDLHCNGKSVVIVETNQEKKILYKPHSLENEIFLQNMVTGIYRDLGLKEFCYLELEKNGYGWVEEVTWKECKSEDKVGLFYQRTGILAAVAYILGMGDLHYENIIAHGEFPVIIDAETLFQNMEPLYQWTEKTVNFYSVLSSGLFPGGTASQNIAGITGGINCTGSKKSPVIMYDRTSKMCIRYQKMRMQSGKNQVRYLGESICCGNYVEEILHGFQLAYEWFCENRHEVLRKIFSIKDKLKSRYVSGATQFFGQCLIASVHPELMSSENERLHYLQNLCKDRQLGSQEAEAMLRGDIPYFLNNLTDRNLYDEKGIILDDFLELTIEEKLKNSILRLSHNDCELQKKVIELSCKLFGGNDRSKRNKQEAVINEFNTDFIGVRCAKRIANYILDNAIREKDKIYWLGLEEENETIRIKPVDVYFYNGIAGIAVFFRKLYQTCGMYGDICEQLETMLYSYTDRIYNGKTPSVTEYPGMYCGEGSMVYAYQLLYMITGQIKYRDYADKHAKVLIRCVQHKAPFDLTYGNAGAVLVLCQQYIDTKNRLYLIEAHKALDYLDKQCIKSEKGITWFESAEESPVCSMAHGNSGVMLAYAKVQSLDGKADYLSKIREIMKYEDQFYDCEWGNWADLRKEKEQWISYSWCNGGVGVIYARFLAEEWNPERFMDKDINVKAENLVKKITMCKEMCLCHGNMGNVLILQKIKKYMGNYANEMILEYIIRVKKSLKTYSENSNRWVSEVNFGFMGGMAGIGIGGLIFMDANYDEVKNVIIDLMENEFNISTNEKRKIIDDSLQMIGIDSIMFMLIIIRLEERYLVEIDFEDDLFVDYSEVTLDMLINAVLKKI